MCICDGLCSWLIHPYYGRFIQKVDFWTLFFFLFSCIYDELPYLGSNISGINWPVKLKTYGLIVHNIFFNKVRLYLCDGLCSWLIYPSYAWFIQKVDFWTLFFFVFLHLWRSAISGFHYLRDYGYPTFQILENYSENVWGTTRSVIFTVFIPILDLFGSKMCHLTKKWTSGLKRFFLFSWINDELPYWAPCHSTTIS